MNEAKQILILRRRREEKKAENINVKFKKMLMKQG